MKKLLSCVLAFAMVFSLCSGFTAFADEFEPALDGTPAVPSVPVEPEQPAEPEQPDSPAPDDLVYKVVDGFIVGTYESDSDFIQTYVNGGANPAAEKTLRIPYEEGVKYVITVYDDGVLVYTQEVGAVKPVPTETPEPTETPAPTESPKPAEDPEQTEHLYRYETDENGKTWIKGEFKSDSAFIQTYVNDGANPAGNEKLTYEAKEKGKYTIKVYDDGILVYTEVVCIHDLDEGVITKEATCTEEGVKTFTCKICGEKITEKLAKIDHKAELKNAKAATCTEAGYTGDEVCTVCGETVKKGEIIEKLERIPNEYEFDMSGASASNTTTAGIGKVKVVKGNEPVPNLYARIKWAYVQNGETLAVVVCVPIVEIDGELTFSMVGPVTGMKLTSAQVALTDDPNAAANGEFHYLGAFANIPVG